MKNILLALTIVTASLCGGQKSEEVANDLLPAGIKDKVLTDNLTYPWEILWGPDNYIWMTERDGRISRVNPATGKVTPIYTIPDVVSRGEGGLLGMVLHPQFANNPYVYVSYDYNENGYKENVVRFTYNGSTLTSPRVLLTGIEAGVFIMAAG